ncbi:MAG: nucleotidyl transferase AbiEii/AbiGii toxin family protein, partial [Acidobacteriaceae bacterium]
DEFVLVGGQALKFVLAEARTTRDFDFLLDAISLREKPANVAHKLATLEYTVVPESRNFQFQKPIPGTNEVMRVEFMAPRELKRANDFRVDIEKGLHARECLGGTIALQESDIHQIQGALPDGTPARASLRVTRSHALVFLKVLALDDRYKNVRGPDHAEHDRNEARVHASDIIAILNAAANVTAFRDAFYGQFASDPALGMRIADHLRTYFREDTSPGMLLYEESLRSDGPVDRETRTQLADELGRAFRMVTDIVPSEAFTTLRSAVDDICNIDERRGLAQDFLRSLKNAGVKVSSEHAIQFFPGEVFGGAYSGGQALQTSAHQEFQKLDKAEAGLLAAYWQLRSPVLLSDLEFTEQFGTIMK